MTVTEFHQATLEALTKQPDELVLKELVEQASKLADMVGWADGIIDKDGSVVDAFAMLQTKARTQHELTSDNSIALLHDTIGEIVAAILRHDEDLA